MSNGHDEEAIVRCDDQTVGEDEGLLAPRSNSFFFMHIAKTAGSFVNSVIRDTLGERFIDHCEVPGRLETTADIALWSGHMFLPRWRNIEISRRWNMKRFTLLREPLAQTASHLLWLDHYAQPEFRAEYNRLDAGTRQVIDAIEATDLSDAGDLDRLLTTLTNRGIQYLDNCQSRYFLAGDHRIGLQDPLHLGMRPKLREAMQEFAVIGVGERMQDFIARLSKEIGVPLTHSDKRVNEAKSFRTIDLSDPDVRLVLSRRLILDLWLYEAASAAA